MLSCYLVALCFCAKILSETGRLQTQKRPESETTGRRCEGKGYGVRRGVQVGVSLDIENYCTVSLFFEQAYLSQ